MENIIAAFIAGVFVAFLLAFMIGLIWLIVSFIIEILSEIGNNSSIYIEYLQKENERVELDAPQNKKKKKDTKFRDGLILGLLLGWFFFDE